MEEIWGRRIEGHQNADALKVQGTALDFLSGASLLPGRCLKRTWETPQEWKNHKNEWCTGKTYSFTGIPEFSEGYQQYRKRTWIINNTKGKQRTLINDGDMIDVTKDLRVILTLPGKEREQFKKVVKHQLFERGHQYF